MEVPSNEVPRAIDKLHAPLLACAQVARVYGPLKLSECRRSAPHLKPLLVPLMLTLPTLVVLVMSFTGLGGVGSGGTPN